MRLTYRILLSLQVGRPETLQHGPGTLVKLQSLTGVADETLALIRRRAVANERLKMPRQTRQRRGNLFID